MGFTDVFGLDKEWKDTPMTMDRRKPDLDCKIEKKPKSGTPETSLLTHQKQENSMVESKEASKAPDYSLLEQQMQESSMVEPKEASKAPDYSSLEQQMQDASKLVDDVILKNYLNDLTKYEVLPLDDDLKKISDIRMFRITEMVYQKNEYSTYKFASVYSAVQNLECGVFVMIQSDGERQEFYMGVRNLDHDRRTTASLEKTLKNALIGQFPGVKTERLEDTDAEQLCQSIRANKSSFISAVSCVAQNKDEDFKDNDTFIQGLEKFALAMQGKAYTAIILARSTPAEQLNSIRSAYETIYTQLSPFSSMQLSYGTNQSLSISDSFSHTKTIGTSLTVNRSEQQGKNYSFTVNEGKGENKTDFRGSLAKNLGIAAVGAVSLLAAPITGGVSLAAGGAVITGLNAFSPKQRNQTKGTAEAHGTNYMQGHGIAKAKNEAEADQQGHSTNKTSGASDNVQLTLQNKSLLNTLERIDTQIKRIGECESVGMWECAAYFLSDYQETAEMAAGTYKALMKGENSGVETAAVNTWTERDEVKRKILRDYISNFVHPVFGYPSHNFDAPISVTAASLISSNELAIHMGLPRQSVCGFPVIEHADFGKEVISYSKNKNKNMLRIGNIFNMGRETKVPVELDCDSLTMHTFVTGSTGSGKSNTLYELLRQVHDTYEIPFLVIEPAKGEYKNVFGQLPDVHVYGTNPNKADLLRINPFRFPSDIHVLEHLDRLVEIFNVCWPMYAAMPAILKKSMEKAYQTVGWDLERSCNKEGDIYPNFKDVLNEIQAVIRESAYSADSKGDYTGALLTRVESLTNGLNHLIFCSDDLTDAQLFDQSVIIDLSRVGSSETKSLIMGILIMRLNEYRMAAGKINSALSHLTVLEEAHNLLKRTSTEQSSESANLAGKSVEMLSNGIAEMRTYGEGFIIADQSPGLLDMSVIRNTNTKIILRLPDQSDRELVGFSAGLSPEQINELTKLKRGVAAIYQNDWVEPVLVQIPRCELYESPFAYAPKPKVDFVTDITNLIIRFLMQGKLRKKTKFSQEDLDRMEQGISRLSLSTQDVSHIKELVEAYREKKQYPMCQGSELRTLSRWITDLLNVRSEVADLVKGCKDTEIERMNLELSQLIQKRASVDETDEDLTSSLCQCVLWDMRLQPDHVEARENAYKCWMNFMKGR